MKNSILTMFVLSIAFSCQQNKKEKENSTSDSTTVLSTEQASISTDSTFELNKVRIADNFEGSFPYFKLPEGYAFTDPNKYHGEGVTNEVDKEYFYNHGVYFPMEGKTFKAQIRVNDEKFKDKKFSKLEVQKSFDELIESLGGVKINNGEPIKKEEKDRISKEDPNAYVDGYLHSCHNFDNVHTYVIRTNDKTVFVQYNLGSEQANLTVLEPKNFENKMSILPVVEIQKQLQEKGKAVLYINFDVDKSTLKPDGKQYVNEIAKLLTDNSDLKLSIEGHTDNTGDAQHNTELSKQRAMAVSKQLTSMGISASRLDTKGFGSEKPLVANDTESNKAKNRRVELIKM